MKFSPPKSMLHFLRWFCREDYLEEIEGDLIELFESQYEENPVRAKWQFNWQVLCHFRPDFIKPLFQNSIITRGMLKHNLTITYRSFLRHKTTFFINLIGLSVGLACTLLIYLWVNDERQIDQGHANNERLYQVLQNYQFPNGIQTRTITPAILAEALEEELPNVESALAISSLEERPEGIISNEEKHQETQGLYAGENFFDVLSYQLLEGSTTQSLSGKNNIVLSEELALKLFGSTRNIIGQSLNLTNQWVNETYQVSGVFRPLKNTSIAPFEFILSLDILLEDEHASKWNGDYAETFVVLQEGTDITKFSESLAPFLKPKHHVENVATLFLQHFSTRYLYGPYENGVQAGGRIVYVKMFSLIAFFILLMACINFMNLSTAQASTKMKEIGVKKVMGARRNSLIVQFLGEALLLTALALIVAINLVWLFLPQFNLITGKAVQLNFNPSLVLTCLAIVIATGLLAGSYSAFYLSGFNPIAVLKGKLKGPVKDYWVRRSLVVFQFCLSGIFLVGLIAVNEQMNFIQTKNLGYDRDNILSFQVDNSRENLELIFSKLESVPGILSVANMNDNVLSGGMHQSGYSWTGQESEQDYLFKSPIIASNLIETLDMKMLQGRSFSDDFKEERMKVVINESARKMMQLENPIGKRLKYGHRSDEREIIGVVSDFNYGSIHHKVEPLIFRYSSRGSNILVKIKSGTEKTTLEQIETIYKESHPNREFTYSFLDDDYQALYEAESRVATLSKYFSLIAIIISCLGLFGLVAFTTARRTKEIGIRKVLGASTLGIMNLLSRDFTKMVSLGVLLAMPISYLILSNWLDNFAYKIELNWWIFIGAAGLTMLIAWLTIGIQTFKTTKVNPVHCLKDE